MISYGSNGKGRLPGWMQLQRLDPNVADVYDDGTGSNQPRDINVSWAAKLLDRLELQTLWQQILTDNNGNGFDYNNPPVIEVFQCPSDTRPSIQRGLLTYVANSGTPDVNWASVNPSNDPNYDTKANGLFHNLIHPEGKQVKYGTDIKDGQATP